MQFFHPLRGLAVLVLLLLPPAVCELDSRPASEQTQVKQRKDRQTSKPQSPQSSQTPGPPEPSPVVRSPVTPNVREADLKAVPEDQKARKWEPGQPVRVVQDLKTSNEVVGTGNKGPAVRKPVAPQTVERNLRDLPKATPPEPGTPVRVVDDLKEDPKSSPTDEPTSPGAKKKLTP